MAPRTDPSVVTSRRAVLRRALAAAGLVAAGPLVAACGSAPVRGTTVPLPGIGGLGEPDAHGVRLPPGFVSRVVATAGMPAAVGGTHPWHRDPDGGAVFPDAAGGWIYVSNSESEGGRGGAGALRFDGEGSVVDSYAILEGTSRNCAGGPTPWGTWLSCEEWEFGRVHECDPSGAEPARQRPALGSFRHEAAAVDPVTLRVYMTEDEPDGRLYRFTPAARLPGGGADLDGGLLEVAGVEDGDVRAVRTVGWQPVPEPNPDALPSAVATRHQVPASTAFDGGEGIFHHGGLIYFTTKGDNRVWMHDIEAATLTLVYDGSVSQPLLSQVDNLTVSSGGTVYVAEDGPGMRIVAFTREGAAGAVLEVTGHPGSELTGPAFDPTGSRLYFSSQRGPAVEGLPWGVTFEVTGPFNAI